MLIQIDRYYQDANHTKNRGETDDRTDGAAIQAISDQRYDSIARWIGPAGGFAIGLARGAVPLAAVVADASSWLSVNRETSL